MLFKIVSRFAKKCLQLANNPISTQESQFKYLIKKGRNTKFDRSITFQKYQIIKNSRIEYCKRL